MLKPVAPPPHKSVKTQPPITAPTMPRRMSTTVPSPVVLTILLAVSPSRDPSKIHTIIDIGPRTTRCFLRALITTAAPAPTTARAIAFPIAATPDEPHDEQQHDSAHGGVDDRGDNSDTKMDTKPSQQPAPNEGTDNTD